jgi:hypothetical protein
MDNANNSNQSNNDSSLNKINETNVISPLNKKVYILIGLIIVAIIVFLVLNCKSDAPNPEHLSIREMNRPGSQYTADVYYDQTPGGKYVAIDDFNELLADEQGAIPGTIVVMYNGKVCGVNPNGQIGNVNCSEDSPLAKVFRSVREQLESPQIKFYERIADFNIGNQSYPYIVKLFKSPIYMVGEQNPFSCGDASNSCSGISNTLYESAMYDGSFDFGEFQDWVLNPKIETLPRAWITTPDGKLEPIDTSVIQDRNYIPCSADCTDTSIDPSMAYPTTLLDPSGASHNHM